jgi:hypothetical protein
MSMAQMKQNKCSFFQFLALYKAQGLEENTDGILGLSPHKNLEKRHLHYLWSLKDSGIIDKPIVSFSISSRDINDESYALFGGINSTQIVGGMEGIQRFASFPNFLGTWSLEGQAIVYNGTVLENTARSYPAIIDTGTSQMSIPPQIFSAIESQWKSAVSDLDCTTDDNFCVSKSPCESLYKKVEPIGIQMSGYVFEIPP